MNPRHRLLGIVLDLAAAALFAISVPLAIVLQAQSLGVDAYEVLRRSGTSLVATLWIFQGIAFGALAAYSGLLVLRKKSEGGGAWLAFGVFATILSSLFLGLTGLGGALFGVAAGVLLIAAGLLDFLAVLRLKLRLAS